MFSRISGTLRLIKGGLGKTESKSIYWDQCAGPFGLLEMVCSLEISIYLSSPIVVVMKLVSYIRRCMILERGKRSDQDRRSCCLKSRVKEMGAGAETGRKSAEQEEEMLPENDDLAMFGVL